MQVDRNSCRQKDKTTRIPKHVAQTVRVREYTEFMYKEGDTITACATPIGESALSIVRLSGPACKAISAVALSNASPVPRKAVYGGFRSLGGDLLDTCVFVWYPDGSSSTGEQMLEIFPHGNPMIVQKILSDLIARGCRPAEPGEFTRRAFLNGKLDLTQAEAVQDLVSARCEAALRAARRQLDGSVGRRVNELLDKMLTVIAHLEAYIDFPEEDIPPENTDGPISQLVNLLNDANRLISTAPYSSMLRDGVRTVLAGATNAGKSSLLNALLGEDRAIVSEEPGTTRDYIEERLIIGNHLLRVVDTAGIRETAGVVEQQGISRSLEQIRKADLVVYVIDTSISAPPPPFPAEMLSDQSAIIVAENKCDCVGGINHGRFLPDFPHVRTSAINGTGIDELKKTIEKFIETRCAPAGQDAVIVSARHAAALKNMTRSTENALKLLRENQPTELAASELREALSSLEEIVGRIDNEQVLDRIFSSFCIGK